MKKLFLTLLVLTSSMFLSGCARLDQLINLNVCEMPVVGFFCDVLNEERGSLACESDPESDACKNYQEYLQQNYAGPPVTGEPPGVTVEATIIPEPTSTPLFRTTSDVAVITLPTDGEEFWASASGDVGIIIQWEPVHNAASYHIFVVSSSGYQPGEGSYADVCGIDSNTGENHCVLVGRLNADEWNVFVEAYDETGSLMSSDTVRIRVH